MIGSLETELMCSVSIQELREKYALSAKYSNTIIY